MGKRTAILVAGAMLLTLGVSALPAVGGGDGGPVCLPGQTFQNDDVAIWFQGMTGFIKVQDKADNGMYFYKSRDVVERDANGDVLAMSLNNAFPKSSSCTVHEDDNFVNMTIAITDTVRSTTGGPVGDATVTIAYHFNKTGLGAKFDLLVDSWPWGSSKDTLAYDFHMVAGDLVLQPADNGVGVENASGDQVGYVDWASNATVTYSDNTTATANVTGTHTGDNTSLEVRLGFGNVKGGYVKLEMDPWFGLGNYVIVAGHLIGLAPVEQLLPGPVQRLVRGTL